MNHRLFKNIYTGGILILCTAIKGRVVPVQAMKEYGGVAPTIHNFNTER